MRVDLGDEGFGVFVVDLAMGEHGPEATSNCQVSVGDAQQPAWSGDGGRLAWLEPLRLRWAEWPACGAGGDPFYEQDPDGLLVATPAWLGSGIVGTGWAQGAGKECEASRIYILDTDPATPVDQTLWDPPADAADCNPTTSRAGNVAWLRRTGSTVTVMARIEDHDVIVDSYPAPHDIDAGLRPSLVDLIEPPLG
jgi:hypothetical protein